QPDLRRRRAPRRGVRARPHRPRPVRPGGRARVRGPPASDAALRRHRAARHPDERGRGPRTGDPGRPGIVGGAAVGRTSGPSDVGQDMTLLELSDLVVGYGGNAVCPAVTLSVGPGDVVAVIGTNGTGKSTLLRTVLGLQEPLSGTVRAFGRSVDERERDFRRRVAGVLDDDAFFPGVTVREHLVLTARGHGVRDAGVRSEEPTSEPQ